MTRREFWPALLSPALTGRVISAAAVAGQPFPGAPFHAYPRCLPDYLRGLAKQAARKRNAELARLVSPEAIRTRQEWVRATLWQLIGGMPERTALNPRTTGSFERRGYNVEKLVYESRPGLFVSANLYLPRSGDGPFPGVLFQSGHYAEGKAYPNYQRCCQGLAQLGFVVLAFDPMGQGERVAYPDSSGIRSRLLNVDAEHTMPGKQMLLYGDTATRFQLWDAVRSLDYLASHPAVDPKRLGSTGHSGGGTLTMLLSAADQRVAAAAPCMGNTENVASLTFLPPGSTDDAEQDFVYSAPAGFDRWDLFYPFAPKPMLIWPSDRDFYATYSPEYIANGWEEFQKLRSVYSVLNQPEHVKWADTPLPHSLAYDSRMMIYNWFTRWLNGSRFPVRAEPPVNPEPVSMLRATESGSTVRSLGSATPFSLNRSRHVRRTPASLESLLRISYPPHAAPARVIAHVESGGVSVEVLESVSDPGVWLPGWVLSPRDVPKQKPVLLVLDPAGAERLWFQPDAESVLSPGSAVVCAADIRGIGALQPEFSPGAPEYAAWHREEENYAWGSLILGKPLVGQRVTDILAITAALRKHPATAGRPVRVAAAGRLTVPALFAAALDKGIDAVYLSEALVSFQEVVDSEQYEHPFADFVPGILNHTDLPEVAASLAPRHIVLAGPLDGRGKRAGKESVLSSYAAAVQAGNLVVEPEPQWSAARLIAFAAG